METRRFKFRREDFGRLPVILRHLNIYLDFVEARVEASNCLQMIATEDLHEIHLDANELRILKVDWCSNPKDCLHSATAPCDLSRSIGPEGRGGDSSQAHSADYLQPLDFEYLKERNKLVVQLPGRVKNGEPLCIRTVTHCIPSDHILEGIYKDATPAGAPQQYMSQCQQWGFQRIMPIFDDCRAKCTMSTTIEADARYTHLISNGNINRLLNPAGKPVLKADDPSRQVISYENPVPMAPYLFLVCAGTWDNLVDEITCPSGRTVRLEYLVPPGRAEGARIPMEILKAAVPWIAKTQDYEYSGDTYRTITMNKSNFGGMENVGNTTIVTDAALIDEHTLDHLLLYAHAVIVHEFEHNQCGSETTMETPFDVWLNEAYTVDVERQFMADMFDAAFIRLNQVESIRNPLLGPLAIEDGGHAGRIVREGFNDPDELIDGVTYVKAAEVIRMLKLILGPEQFKAAKTLYFSRYRNGNANTDQFFQCFEEVSGTSLEQFKKRWLFTIGYPEVSSSHTYNHEARTFVVRFRQELNDDQEPFHIPIQLALVDAKGRDIGGTEQVFQLKTKAAELTFGNISEPPAFASINRDYSFYGTFRNESATTESMALQARLDPNAYNRVEAVRQLTDVQRIRLLQDIDAGLDEFWLDLYGEILDDLTLPLSLKAYFLRIDEQPLDRSYATWYQELVAAREKLLKAVNGAYREKLIERFSAIDTHSTRADGSPKEGIEERLLKNVLLELIAVDDEEQSHRLIVDHYRSATNVTDKVAALTALNRSSAPQRRDLLEAAYRQWHAHLSGYSNYLRIVASGTCHDVFEMIETEKRRPTFDITQPTWCRALFLPMATNNKMVWTERGIRWVVATVIELSPINTTTASRLLNTFQQVKKLKPELREKVLKGLEEIVRHVSEKANPTIHGQAGAYLGRA